MTTNNEKAALRRAAKILHGQAAIARLCGYKSRRNVWPWFARAGVRIPAEHCPTIEAATRARGQVVTCEELRPDVAWSVLRSGAPFTDGEGSEND